MTLRRTAAAGIGLVLVAALVWTTRGDGGYHVHFSLKNASGLKNGSPVVIGGVVVGQTRLHVERDDVRVDLEIEDKYAPIGRDATASVVARNLLGQKQVSVAPGSRSRPARDGAALPRASVSVATDLDQVFDVLTPDTRARLAVALNEAGLAVSGRRLDLDTFIHGFPTTIERASVLADQLAGQNHTLRELVSRTDRYLDTVTADRAQLVRLVANAGTTATTVAEHRDALGSTLKAAPGGLREARGFLADLRGMAPRLTQTARNLQLVAEPLQQTLTSLPAFAKAGGPTLDAATSAAPALSQLGKRVTPVLEQGQPTLRAVAQLTGNELAPTARILDGSFANFVAVLENWSRAVQFRDRLSHVFRAELGVPVNSLVSALDRLNNAAKPAVKAKAKRAATKGPAVTAPAARPSPAAAEPAPAKPKSPLGNVAKGVQDTVGTLLERLGVTKPKKPTSPDDSAKTPESPARGLAPLLDYLLRP